MAYARRIGLLRSFYPQLSPELEPYLVVVRGTHSATPLCGPTLAPAARQPMLTTAGMVAVVNGVVMGGAPAWRWRLRGGQSVAIPVAAGAVMVAGAYWLHERHHRRARDAYSPEAVDRAAIVVPPADWR